MRETEGGCQVPIGVRTQVENDTIYLKGIILSVDGSKSVDGDIKGPIKDAKSLGKQLAERLKGSGADAILKEVFESTKKEK